VEKSALKHDKIHINNLKHGFE